MANTPTVQTFAPAQSQAWRVGQTFLPSLCLILSLAIAGAVKQVSTLTVDSASDADYVFQLRPSGGAAITVTYAEGATGTTSTKAAGIAALINARADLASFVRASSSSNVVTITSLVAGQGFTLSDSDAKLTSANSTANALAGDVEFGAAVVRNASDATKIQAPDEANNTAKVMTATIANATNNESYTITVVGDFDRDGKEEIYSLTYSDGSASVARAANFFQRGFTAAIAAGVTVTDNGSVVTFAGAKGIDFKVIKSIAPAPGDDNPPTGTITLATSTALVMPEFAGVAMARQVPETRDGVAKWRGADQQPVPVCRKGLILARLDDAVSSISPSDPVLYRVNDDGAGEINGSFANAASGTDLYALPSTRARWLDGQIFTDADGHKGAFVELL